MTIELMLKKKNQTYFGKTSKASDGNIKDLDGLVANPARDIMFNPFSKRFVTTAVIYKTIVQNKLRIFTIIFMFIITVL